MKFIHEELRKAREAAGMTQQTLANLAGIPRNQVVRAERGDNITLDTLRKLAAHLPVTELTLLDTTELRVDVLAAPEKIFFSAFEHVIRQTVSLASAIKVAMEAATAVKVARRSAPPPPEGFVPAADVDPMEVLSGLQLMTEQILTIAGQKPDGGS